MKTWVYSDGFNLYYGAVKDTSYRWLDLNWMCQLLPGHQIAKIKYFTAPLFEEEGHTRSQDWSLALNDSLW